MPSQIQITSDSPKSPELILLGPVKIFPGRWVEVEGGRRIRLTQSLPHSLLIELARAAKRQWPCMVDDLISTLWPANAPIDPNRALANVVRRLRQWLRSNKLDGFLELPNSHHSSFQYQLVVRTEIEPKGE
jgi:hypothetical protein